MKLKLSVIALAGLFLASCGGADTPEVVVKNFFDAIKAKDMDKAKSFATVESEKMIDMMAMGPAKEITKVECKTEGETADCECWAKDEEETQKVAVKKVDGAWKVNMSKGDQMNDAMNTMGDISTDAVTEGIESATEMIEEGAEMIEEGAEAVEEVKEKVTK